MRAPHAGRATVAVATALSLILAPAARTASAQTAEKQAAKPDESRGAEAKTAGGAADQKPEDRGWPRTYPLAGGGEITVYQPQVADWPDQKHMTAYAAVAYLPPGEKKPQLGSIRIEADTKVSVQERLVDFAPLEITEANFQSLPREKSAQVVKALTEAIPDRDRVISLDRVLAGVDRSQIMPKNVEGVKADPPRIFFSSRPAVLVNLDGDPVWSPVQGTDLQVAVNTNWDLFRHEASGTLFLRNDKSWLQATALDGPWTPAQKLPAGFSKLPAGEDWKDVKAALPGTKTSADKVPAVFVSTTPAELILLAGAPKYQPVPGTSLVWVANTESDVFRAGRDGPVYYLVAGRWFSAPDFAGPWKFVTPELPPDFQKIPLDHPRSRVLASVPGTRQAAEAVLLAQIPQTARVKRSEVKAPEVDYQGDPQFEKIEKTSVARAVNTDKNVIKADDKYYLCHDGVWFVGPSPTGPFAVATSIPQEIYQIPISSPAHTVTYVTVEDSDDEWVTFASAAMYTGVMVAWGTVVWGSGWYYRPYVGWGGAYPAYFAHYPTYGYRAAYNPWTGTYARGARAYGPYGGAGVGARYNPRTGTYARGVAAAGPYGAGAAARAYNPRTGAHGATRQGANVYGSWGTTAVQRGDAWATTSRATSARTGATARRTETSAGGEAVTRSGPRGSATVGRTAGGDVYAGRDGNVYRREGDSWQRYDNGRWEGTSQAQRATTDQLQRDSFARNEGAQRSRDYDSFRSGSGSADSFRGSGGAGAYRGSGSSMGRAGGGARGGGARGGGGRR